MATLKSKLRRSLMSSHSARKNTKNALWLAYSPKLEADIALASNNECVYWLTQLEMDSEVRSFQFGYEASLKLNDEVEFKPREVIRTDLINGDIALHILTSGDGGITQGLATLKVKPTGREGLEEKIVKVFKVHSDHLRHQSKKATRTLRLIGFASQIRERKNPVIVASVELVLQTLRAGRVEQIILAMHRHDPMIVLGILCEKILSGSVEIDLADRSFGNHSYWSLK